MLFLVPAVPFFTYSLVPRYLESTAVTAAVVFTLAGILVEVAAPATAKA